MEEFEEDFLVRDPETDLVNHHLYLAKFRFPDDCLFPTLAIRYKDTLINVLDSGEEFYWLWGVELKQAIELCACVVHYNKRIRYLSVRTHHQFIDYFYKMRQEAKLSKNDTDNLTCKIIMNSEYGKHGQQSQAHVTLGGRTYTDDMHAQLRQAEFIPQETIKVQKLSSNYFDLFQIKYQKQDMEYSNAGASVRLASYITAISRVNLMFGVHAAAAHFGPRSVCYVDTDSIYIDVLESLTLADKDYAEAQINNGQRSMQDLLQNHYMVSEFIKHSRMPDITNLCSGARMNIIDNDKLGAYKIERYVYDARFLGSK